jgi:predicted ATPase
MLKRIRLEAFKSVGEAVELELAPLTLIAGPNSSGKSTVLQSILLVAQTMSSKVTARPLVLNGPTVRLGTFDDVLSYGAKRRVFSLGFDLDAPPWIPTGLGARPAPRKTQAEESAEPSLNEVSLDVSFKGPARRSKNAELPEQQMTLAALSMKCDYLNADGENECIQLKVNQASKLHIRKVEERLSEHYAPSARAAISLRPQLDRISLQALKSNFGSARPVGVTAEHFLPRRLAVEVDTTLEGINQIVQDILQFGGGRSRLFARNQVSFPPRLVVALAEVLDEVFQDKLLATNEGGLTLPTWHERFGRLPVRERQTAREQLRKGAENIIQSAFAEPGSSEYDIVYEPLPGHMDEVSRHIDQFFSKRVRYLGPLRDEPRPTYPLSSSGDILDLGTKGEFTAAVLDLNRDVLVSYLSSEDVAAGRYDTPLIGRRLIEAVDEWIQYIGVSEGVVTRDLGSRGHELRVRKAGMAQTLDLTQVGVGVSQVLPIILLGLVAPKDSLTIFEQPELHLHPRVQTLLGDFFVSMIHSGLQCLVETHSEYLVNRLRLRTAATDSNLQEKLRIYFTENDGTTCSYRSVEMNEYGGLTDWPAGFFDQSQQESEAIIRAGIAKRKIRGKSGSAHRNN